MPVNATGAPYSSLIVLCSSNSTKSVIFNYIKEAVNYFETQDKVGMNTP